MDVTIRNTEALGVTPLRRDALAIAEAGYAAINTRAVLQESVRLEGNTLTVTGQAYTLAEGQGVWVVGAGKCAIEGAAALEEILGDRVAGGVVVDVADTKQCLPLRKIQCFLGSHPEPSEANVTATRAMIDVLTPLGEQDIVIMIVSGGGSTLLCLPEGVMTCIVEAAVFDELTDAGATIQEMNTVRKHLSRARGGMLAKEAYPARVIGLVFSDVPGNDIAVIASGPTVRDHTTVADAQAIINKYHVQALANIPLLETPKEADYFERVHNVLLVTNTRALEAMATVAKARGYAPYIITDRYSGEARDLAAQIVKKLATEAPGTALLYGGESTVTLGAHAGQGGRNQELALAALAHIADGELVLPLSSDGHDNTDVAGALCDSMTRAHAREQGLVLDEYLAAHRSYDFFQATEDALDTGYTGSNVSDLIIALNARVT